MSEDYPALVERLQFTIKELIALDQDRVTKIESLQATVDGLLEVDKLRLSAIERGSAKIDELLELNVERVKTVMHLEAKLAEMLRLDENRLESMRSKDEKVIELVATVEELGASLRALSAECDRLSYLAVGKEMGDGPPVMVVNSLPKTGSQTVMHSIEQANKGFRVFHHHALSDAGMIALMSDIRNSRTPKEAWFRLEKLRQTINIRQDIENEKIRTDGRRAFFFCGVREPVSLFISYVFQLKLERDDVKETGDGPLVLERLVDMLDGWYSKPSVALVHYLPGPDEWLQREISEFLNVDPFKLGFNYKAGYQIYDSQSGPLIVYRTENLNKIFDTAIAEFLGPLGAGITRRDHNLASEKAYSADYEYVKRELVVPAHVLDKVYGGAYARTFYSPSEIAKFRAHWAATRR